MRGVGIVAASILLAGCETAPPEGGNPGLFEPFMLNDKAYDATFIRVGPVTDADLLAQGFVASRDIRITRLMGLTGGPFGATDEAEARAVAAAFCGDSSAFMPDAEAVLDGSGGFVFSRSCLERAV